MTDFPLYDVVKICRQCGTEYSGKAFLPQGSDPRFGLCPPCLVGDDAKMAQLKQPPKDHGRPKGEPERREAVRRTTPQRRQTRWEPD